MATQIVNINSSQAPTEIVLGINNNVAYLNQVKANSADLGTAATKNVGTAAGNVVQLNANGLIDSNLIGDLFVTNVFEVATYNLLTTLSTAKTGDLAIVQSDTNNDDQAAVYVLSAEPYSTLANWKFLPFPASVVSVNGKTGAVVIAMGDISGLTDALAGKLATNGDGSNVTVTFTAPGARANITSGDTLATAFGKLAKLYTDLGSLAFKSSVGTGDFASSAKAPFAGTADKVGHSITFSGAATGSFDGSADLEVNIAMPDSVSVDIITFTANVSADSWVANGDGTYTLTRAHSGKNLLTSMPEKLVSTGVYASAFCTVRSDATNLYIVSDTPFAGRVKTI